MAIAVVCLVTWAVIIVFAIVPKWFTLVEMVFLYFVISILTVAIFTILDLNLHWVPATRNVAKANALNICRFVKIPALMILSSSLLNSPLRAAARWTLAGAICLFLTVDDWILRSLGIIVYRHWNSMLAFLNYGVLIVVMGWIARWFVHLRTGEQRKLDSLR